MRVTNDNNLNQIFLIIGRDVVGKILVIESRHSPYKTKVMHLKLCYQFHRKLFILFPHHFLGRMMFNQKSCKAVNHDSYLNFLDHLFQSLLQNPLPKSILDPMLDALAADSVVQTASAAAISFGRLYQFHIHLNYGIELVPLSFTLGISKQSHQRLHQHLYQRIQLSRTIPPLLKLHFRILTVDSPSLGPLLLAEFVHVVSKKSLEPAFLTVLSLL